MIVALKKDWRTSNPIGRTALSLVYLGTQLQEILSVDNIRIKDL